MRFLLACFLCPAWAWANDVVVCDPTHPLVPNAVSRFEQTVDFPETPGFLVWIAPNNSMTLEKQMYMNTLRGQIDSLSGIPHRYWLCTDTNPVDGILESVTEMSQVQKDAVDAPQVAEQQRQQAFTDEIATNTFCDGTLADVKAAVDAQIDSWVTARQTEINATTNFATLKAALRDQTMPAIGAVMKTGLKKIVGCVRARAR
jgi:hypothetical protein